MARNVNKQHPNFLGSIDTIEEMCLLNEPQEVTAFSTFDYILITKQDHLSGTLCLLLIILVERNLDKKFDLILI